MATASLIEQPRPHTGLPAATAKSATSPTENKQGKVVPVDVPKLTDIPGYMDTLKWPVSAVLMRKWFAAKARTMTPEEKEGKVSPTKDPAHLLDTTSVKIDWILSFPRVKAIYDEALAWTYLKGYPLAIIEAQKQLAKRVKRAGLFTDRQEKFGDVSQPAIWQHERFQFRLIRVDSSMWTRSKVLYNGIDDLFGALASFGLNFSAAGTVTPKLKEVVVDKVKKNVVEYYTIEVSHLIVYARDTYDFNGPQYLGHWNKNGVEVVKSYATWDLGKWLDEDDYQVSGDPPDMKLPVGNWSYRKYREKHNMGGDLLIFTDTKVLKLNRPLRVSVTAEEAAALK